MITKEQLEEKIANYKKQQANALTMFQTFDGAIQVLQELIKELESPPVEEQPKQEE